MTAKQTHPQAMDALTPEEKETVMQMRSPSCLLDDLQQMADLFVQITHPDSDGFPPEITEGRAVHWLACRLADRAQWMREALDKEKVA
ncbi:hypothetical protein AA0242T_2304 [Acetobacter aceti NRIC 0242]|uniref:Uncharacterized protein n=1 Tax=Acetobacter aceti NBRC 14818 TaxID=887700 RepID=A0AB33IE70_ACEAC|nr:hypothetical protein [Acetobacter aceti]TCS33051.1 hypothetical protein EDC15_109123 [Acetobacter aceti NBRC 14818]BCK76485.1 hypothetical protein EMQ_2091 [Acetobacter aceti NBRC 14818]GAN56225.1 hypothetical protein Abac_003_124 [Acetobacter aceti NBRC 14818]GBO81602.1 hypothetical protein AA0242T_2304 [Acetobacter aceti NRIC 0242]